MAWGSHKPNHEPSIIIKLLPLILGIALIAGAGWVGYQIYISVNKIRDNASQSMGNKNVVFTKDGVKVGVKQVKNENYVDATQGWVVKAWNLGQSREDEALKKQQKNK